MEPADPAGGVERLFAILLEVWPQHEKHLSRTVDAMNSIERRWADITAGLVLRIAGPEIRRVCQDYAWLCGQMQEEQLHFARSGQYRLSTFREAREQVYENVSFMERYLNGLLIGRIAWLEQLRMLAWFAEDFLPGNRDGFEHLEIGPGHGLLLYLASRDSRCAAIAGMDISPSSLEATARCMARLDAPAPELLAHDILADGPQQARTWDSIVVSEVLEHLEGPERALRRLASWLRPGGRIFVTTPVNSPMPDHIYLFRDPGEVLALVTGAGLAIRDHRFFTAAGVTEEKARRRSLPIACAVIAERPGSRESAA